MPDEKDTEDIDLGSASASGITTATATATGTVSYISAFPKRQMEYAQSARDKAGKIEVVFGGEDVLMVPDEENRDHQQYIISAIVNSLGFLEGQKYWFIHRLEDGEWDFDNQTEMQETGWNGLEDAFVRMLDVCDRENGFLNDSPPYKEVKVLREFRNDLLHFESPKITAGEKSKEYDIDEELESLDFSKNPIGGNNSYPFKWFSYELAERSVRMSFTLWRFFGGQLDKEEEFLKGIPSP